MLIKTMRLTPSLDDENLYVRAAIAATDKARQLTLASSCLQAGSNQNYSNALRNRAPPVTDESVPSLIIHRDKR